MSAAENADGTKPGADLSIVDITSLLVGETAQAAAEVDLVSPPGLSPGAAALWHAIAGTYELRPDDWAVLDMAARMKTLLDAAESEWEREGRPMTAAGYMDRGMVEHPLVTLQDKLAKSLAAHLRQLRLPDLDTGFSPFSHQGRGQTGGQTKAANNPAPNRRTNHKKKQED